MAKFAYNNAKNIITCYILFELNYSYYPQILYKKDVNLCSKLKIADMLLAKLKDLMIV